LPGEMKSSRRSVITSALAAAALPSGALVRSARADVDQRASDTDDFNVRAFGAKGDGSTDDTPAVQSCVTAALTAGAGRVYFPAGSYVLTAPITLASKGTVDLAGDGQSSVLIWKHPGHAIWWKAVPAARSSVGDLRIAAAGPKNAESAAICCDSGATDMLFGNLWLDSFDEGRSSVPIGMLFGDGKYTTDKDAKSTLNVTVENCYFCDVSHVGLSVGAQGEFRVTGGRFIAANLSSGYCVGSIGILLRGWMGGFHLTDTDVSCFEVGMQIGAARRDQHPDAIQNREIFITHATPDSCRTGLAIYDDSYVSIAGCWAASSKDSQINVLSSAVGAKLVISGGTIFNGGRNPTGNLAGGAGNGLVMQGGTLLMSGVYLRSSVGKPIDLGPNVRYAISGCIFEDNGKPPVFPQGPGRVLTGNIGI
jgi:hypothetical protein